jgi:hypothetical protein
MSKPARKSRVTQQLEILALRSLELADQVAAGHLPFIDAVDMAYSAAQWAGLPETVGDNTIKLALSASFPNARRL